MNYCSQCGSQLSQGDKFCPNCGATTPAQHQPPQATQPPPPQPQPSVQHGHTPQPQPDPHAATAGSVPTFEYNDGRPHSRIETHIPQAGVYETDATVEFGDLHPTAIWLFFISYLSKSAILIPLILVGIFIEPLLAALFIVYILGHYIMARVTYRNYKFEITPTAFKKEYGILHKQSSSIPFDRVQNVNVSRNLIDRFLGLAHLEIETAGGSGDTKRNVLGGATSRSEGYIPGVSAEEAQDIKELIMARAQRIKSNQPHSAA